MEPIRMINSMTYINLHAHDDVILPLFHHHGYNDTSHKLPVQNDDMKNSWTCSFLFCFSELYPKQDDSFSFKELKNSFDMSLDLAHQQLVIEESHECGSPKILPRALGGNCCLQVRMTTQLVILTRFEFSFV